MSVVPMLPRIASGRVEEGAVYLPTALFGWRAPRHGIDLPGLEVGYSKQTRWVRGLIPGKGKRAYCFCSCWLGHEVIAGSPSRMKLEVRSPSMDEEVMET